MARNAAAMIADSDVAPVSRDVEPAAIRHRHVLIAEDDSSMRDFLDRLLRAAGYRTVRAVDGKDALEIAALFGPFDLLLTDLVMPRIGGAELARRLRQKHGTLKVLYFTGYADRLFREKGALWNDEAFLEKPASVDGLLEAVSLLLDGHVRMMGETNGSSHQH